LTTDGQLSLAVAVAEKAVVTNALETLGQDMQQEAANKLVGIERHGLLLLMVAIIFPSEADLAVVDIEQAVIGNSHPMSVPT
jgi:hypothetical protein